MTTDRWVPRRPGALPLVVARTDVAGFDVGVVLGVGDPAVFVERLPQCGCDACDSGSQAELDELDRHVFGVVSGRFRRLVRGERQITVVDGDGWSASSRTGFPRGEVEAAIVDPTGMDRGVRTGLVGLTLVGLRGVGGEHLGGSAGLSRS